VGFGIVSEEKVAQEMFEQMPHLEKGSSGKFTSSLWRRRSN
jgi:hypothetical protein